MDHHFRAFSFVDRIRSIEPAGRVSGSYAIPGHVESFPLSLAAEAVGQLAAWAAMSAMDFNYRPVAGIAARVELLAPVLPGQQLELTAELDSVDREAIAYGGTARIDGRPVIRLEHCVGPMMPVEEFDDPRALRDRLNLLQDKGAVPGAFNGLPGLPTSQLDGDPGQTLTATLQIPASAPFYADHFPRRPVFPGTLLMHVNLRVASLLAEQFAPPTPGHPWRLSEITNMKLRAFTPPDETLEIQASLQELTANVASVRVQTRNSKGRVGNAQVHFVPGGGQ